MSTLLARQSYGKSNVRLMKVTRDGGNASDAVHELSVDIALDGEFQATYSSGDNRQVIPTDTMKNLVYVLGRNGPIDAIEPFALRLAKHFLEQYPQVAQAAVTMRQIPWRAIVVDGEAHGHAFASSGDESPTALVVLARQGAVIESGIDDVEILKTADSAFCDFHHDQWTTLKDAPQRLFRTVLRGRWRWIGAEVEFAAANAAIRTALLETFANHQSLSVQHTLCAMGQRALDCCRFIDRITLSLPNRHCNLIDLSPFGLDNPQMIFAPTDEPHGMIEATIERR